MLQLLTKIPSYDMNINLALKEQIDFDQLPQEAMQVLEILDQLENHTANLRKKLMSEIRPSGNVIHLKLDNIK